MKLLFIHADYIEYETKEKTKFAEEIEDSAKKGKMEECLVVFCSVEKNDNDRTVKIAVDNIKDVLTQLKTKKVLIYPYAHLSSFLATPEKAKELTIAVENLLKEEYEVKRSPFGWYKAFKISCKGHPLSELSREIIAEEKISREEVVEKIKSEFIILTQNGEEFSLDLEENVSVEKFDEIIAQLKISKENDFLSMKTFIASEFLKGEKREESPSIKTMQMHELVDYEDASDSGHFRLYPKGNLIFDLLTKWAKQNAIHLNCMEINTPILYNWALPDIHGQAKSFHERHYIIQMEEEKKEFVLRFAGDFGLFRMMKDATISYKQLPIRIYEFSKSFRLEQKGELSGLKRLRAFHMPDIHCFAKDLEQGWEEYKEIYNSYAEMISGMNIEYVISFRIVKEFYNKYKDKIVELLKFSKKPAFIELLSERKHYWVVKNEFQAIDSVNGSCQLSTVQLDIEDAERYGIVYVDNEGKKHGCIICHSSIGSIERWIYAILENALKKEKPELPFWLSPTQIRLIPVANDFLKNCEEIANNLNARVDIDDREESLSRKIRDAEKEWINFIVVYGKKEKKSGKLSIRLRSGEVKEFTLEELKEEIKKLQKDYPFEKLAVNKFLSKRIVFRG